MKLKGVEQKELLVCLKFESKNLLNLALPVVIVTQKHPHTCTHSQVLMISFPSTMALALLIAFPVAIGVALFALFDLLLLGASMLLSWSVATTAALLDAVPSAALLLVLVLLTIVGAMVTSVWLRIKPEVPAKTDKDWLLEHAAAARQARLERLAAREAKEQDPLWKLNVAYWDASLSEVIEIVRRSLYTGQARTGASAWPESARLSGLLQTGSKRGLLSR
jgi:hypothetical protein